MRKNTKRKPTLPRVPVPKPTKVIPNKKKDFRDENWQEDLNSMWEIPEGSQGANDDCGNYYDNFVDGGGR